MEFHRTPELSHGKQGLGGFYSLAVVFHGENREIKEK